jgi:hypothetical protein
MFPKTRVLAIITSTSFPVNAFTAGIVVIRETRQTKTKLAFALRVWGNNRMDIIPAIGNSKANENTKDSVIYVQYSYGAGFSPFPFIRFI